jgi:hypothetical protein
MLLRIITGNLFSKISSVKMQVFSMDSGKLNGRSHVRVVHQNHDRIYQPNLLSYSGPFREITEYNEIKSDTETALTCENANGTLILLVYKIFYSIIVTHIPSNANQPKRNKCYKLCPHLSTPNNPTRYPEIPQ